MISTDELVAAFVVVGTAMTGVIVLLRKLGLSITKNNKRDISPCDNLKELVIVVTGLTKTQIRQDEILLNHSEQLRDGKSQSRLLEDKLELINSNVAILLDRSNERRRFDSESD